MQATSQQYENSHHSLGSFPHMLIETTIYGIYGSFDLISFYC